MNQRANNHEDQRLAEILEIILKFAAGDLAARATLAGDGSAMDGVMAGINNLGEALETQGAEDKLTAEALHKANDDLSLFRKLLDSSSDAIEVVDPATLRFLDVNETACRTLGYSREELLAMSVHDIDPNSGTDVFQKLEEKMRQSGTARFETSHRRKDGSTFPVEVSMGTVSLDKLYGLAIVRDITERQQVEEKMREQQDLTTKIIETIPLRVFWKDRDLRYLGCNSLFAKDAGLTHPEELIGKTDFEMGWKDQADIYQADDQQVMDANSSMLSYDEPQTTPEGGQIWLRTSKVPLHNEMNETIGVLGIYEDITAYKQAAQKLEESELRFRTILDATVDGILVADAQTQALVTANKAICEMLGYSMQELYDLGIEDVHPTEALPQVRLQFEHQLHNESKTTLDLPVKRKDGSVFFVDLRTAPMVLGERQFLVGVFHDVTERKAAEKTLHDQFHLLQVILDTIPNPVFYKDTGGVYTGCNKAFEEYLGREKEQIVGKSVYDLAPKELADTYHKRDMDLLEEQEIQSYESSVVYADKTKHEVMFNKAPIIHKDGSLGGLVGVILDITERKLAEEELQRYTADLENKNRELQEALAKVKQLSGLLPICASCKKIRDDKGYWSGVETYLGEHTEAVFSHGLCPECEKKALEDLAQMLRKNK